MQLGSEPPWPRPARGALNVARGGRPEQSVDQQPITDGHDA
jgi:hypothetical protein